MKKPGCCEGGRVRIEKVKNNCDLCDSFAERHRSKPVVVLSCEGACLRGEVARQAARMGKMDGQTMAAV